MHLSLTIPESFLERRGAKDMPDGASGWFPAAALRIDCEGRGWINPAAESIDSRVDDGRYDPEASGPVFSFERATDAGAGGLVLAWIGGLADLKAMTVVGLTFTALTILLGISREVRAWYPILTKIRDRERPRRS